MDVGTAVIFQNKDRARPDRAVYRDDLALADLAEPLGFDSLWSVEHHFTDYTMCPDVMQLLAYFAGRTQRIRLGSMVIVLPWHHPARAAEEIAMLDHVCDGRTILGIGRGIGRVEFAGLGIDQNESRTAQSAAGSGRGRMRNTRHAHFGRRRAAFLHPLRAGARIRALRLPARAGSTPAPGRPASSNPAAGTDAVCFATGRESPCIASSTPLPARSRRR